MESLYALLPEALSLSEALRLLPLDCLQVAFMRQALLAVLLLAPMTAALGVSVITFRMAFFSDAIGHSAFAGVAIGLLLSLDPLFTMPAFGVLVGLCIMAVRRGSLLSADTSIGIVFSAVVAFGLAVVSRAPGMSRSMTQFLYGDILTVSPAELGFLALLLPVLLVFAVVGFNRLLLVALNPVMARAHGVRVAIWQYAFAALLSLVVMLAVRAVGVLLVTALLIVPAATARHLARTAGGMFWWAQAVALFSGVSGLLLSAQPWLGTASGATIILVSCACFLLSALWARRQGHRRA
ncbi:MAG TPA: metal ABC transporter permease [Candidatus Desulfovibrio intestinavium]|uniref:Metal ABC transporter permease n=1 Tax=Candidatus Desulfovibrio intestinavium TaxID=2838534 RepID=A0A9D2HQD4_9BACT|nr:metal ABC transporter permease [Candidatus Desulfovibrio intestinavium]